MLYIYIYRLLRIQLQYIMSKSMKANIQINSHDIIYRSLSNHKVEIGGERERGRERGCMMDGT